MRILHYSLGLPPYRSGGLTKFCTDLMKQQFRDGNEIALLWPGRMEILIGNTKIKDKGKSLQGDSKIQNYEIINPVPVPYDEGIKEFGAFKTNGDAGAYFKLFNEYQPDVIHVHTLMGLHKSFLLAAKEKGIRLVFSAHDFFPICSKVTLFRDGNICRTAMHCKDCGECNTTALSMMRIRLLQSAPYRAMKDSYIVRNLRKAHRDVFLSEEVKKACPIGNDIDYLELRNHYRSMLGMFDSIHYNSSLTESVYREYFPELSGHIIPISHEGIGDHRKEKIFSEERIRIRYLGSYSKGKGYWRIREALDRLWMKRQDFCLDVHFDSSQQVPYVVTHNRYNYSDLETIFDQTDVLVVPSVWYETFGYTVLEALSYGVPVIVADTVGSKDIIADGAGIIFAGNDLYQVLKELDTDKLYNMNQAILSNQKIITVKKMAQELMDQCYIL